MIDLATLASAVGLRHHGDAHITSATHDSRRVAPGDLYIAVPGAHTHGSAFIAQALEAGAVAIATDDVTTARGFDVPLLELTHPRSDMARIAAEVHGHPERDLVLVGVTGTNGKTTVTTMINFIVNATGKRSSVIGTLSGARTTPEATDLMREFADLRAEGFTHVVMEVSSHGLELQRVEGLQFAVGAFTNLTQDHLDFHGSMESYFEAKAKLFAQSDSSVINTDDSWGELLAQRVVGALTVGRNGAVIVTDVASSLESGVDFTLTFGPHSHSVRVPMLGSFNADNAALAVAACGQLGIDYEFSISALATFPGVPGRMERIDIATCHAVVDYAHTPDAVDRVLRVLDDIAPASVITVMGCGGDRDPSKREHMGRIAASMSDVVVVTDDNPRTEDPATIRAQVVAGATGGRARLHDIGNRRAAIAYALSIAETNDIVAVLGKGHESGQEIAGVVHPFDDRDVVRQESAHA